MTIKYDRLMLDLETMGLPPTGAIVQIGACFFDMETCTIGPRFNRAVHLASSVELGMVMEPSTVLWWLRQSPDAQKAICFNLVTIRSALDDFRAFINEHSREKDVHVYGNGAAFDLTILGAAYKLAGQDAPWSFGRERCFRTLRNLYPQFDINDTPRPGTHHDAADDAEFQCQHLFRIKKGLAHG